MKRTIKHFLIILIAGLLAVSCVFNIGGGSWVGICTENGIDYTEIRDVKTFCDISSNLPCNVYYTQADKQEVRVESTQEFASKVQTEVKDGVLKLKLEEGRYPKLILRVVITSPDLESVAIRGGGDLIFNGRLVVPNDLSLSVSGSGSITADDICCKDFGAAIRGSGDLCIANLACAEFIAAVNGSGLVEIENLAAKDDAAAGISGSGCIYLHEVTVDGDMDLQLSGSGSLLVNGRCREVDAATSGSGSISGNLSHTAIRTYPSGSGYIDLQ